MISQILRQTRRSQLLAAAENTGDADNEGGKEIIAVFECKHCDKVSKTEEEMYEHVEDCHRTGRETRASPRSPSPRSVVMKGLLATSFQKNVYVPERLMCTDGDDEEQPEMYTVYGCTLCHYQHLSNTQVRKHGTMCHFLEIPVFSCLYCKVAVADRAVFHRHLEHEHRLMKVDFSFDCKALTLLNQFLSESLYQIHIKKEGFYEVIKDRSEQFTHYSKQKMLSLIPSEDTKEKFVASTSSESPPAKSPRKVTRQSPASLQLTEDTEVTNSKAETEAMEEPSSIEGITKSSTPTKGFPRNTVRAILDSMVQRKTGTKKKYLRGAVKDLLKELREESGKADKTEGLVEMASEAIVDAEAEISSPQNKSSGEAIVQQNTKEMCGETIESLEYVTKVKIEKVEGENMEVPEKAKCTVTVPEPNNQETPKRKRGRPRKSDKFQMMDTQKYSKEGCVEIREEDVILMVKKEVVYEGSGMPEKDSALIQPTTEQITPKRRRGRPRKSGPLVEKDKEYKPQFEQSPIKKKIKIVDVTEKPPLGVTVDSPDLSPGRYNFRNRKNNRSFTDELQQSEEEEEENAGDAEEQKKPTLHSLVNTKQKMFVKTFRKLVSKSEIPQEKIEERLPKPTAADIVKSPLAAQPPVATVISPPMQAMQPGLRPQTYVMVNGRLLPIINQSQMLQLGPNTGLRPQIIQLPTPQIQQQQPQQQQQIQQQPQIQQQQANQNLILNLLSQAQQQQQFQPILNQQTQQPFIIQQPGGLQGNQTFQLLPQNNTMMLQGSVPNLQGQMPFIIRPVTSNVLNLGNQIMTPVSVQQQQPTPVLGTNVTSTTVPSNLQPLAVKPIVIEPKEDLSDPIDNSDSETEADAEPEDCPSEEVASTALSELQNVKQFYIQLYVCRRCMQIFLTPLDLDQHLYIEERERNPTMNVPFSNVGQDFFRKLTITPMVSVLLKDSEWNLPVFRCGTCGIVHILESFVKKHVKEHALGLKCLKESLWSPSDLRVLCAKGWTTSVKMQCREQAPWANIFNKKSRGRSINNSRENMRVSISELEKIDAEAKGQAPNKKAVSQLTSSAHSTQQPVLQQADSQASSQPKTLDTMPQATVGMHPGQIPLQGRFLNFVKPTVANIAPKVSANQFIPGTQFLQIPGTRIIQLPPVSQPSPFQIVPITQPATMSQPLNMFPQPISSSSKLDATSFFCKKCQFKHTTSDGVKDHVLQNHMEDFGPAFKCTACSEAAYSITKITEHIMAKHPAFKSPFQVNRVYDPDLAAKTLIVSSQSASASASAGSEQQQQQNKESADAPGTVEQMEPDSSCDAGQDSSEQKLGETTGDSNLSGILAPNILSCFSEEDEGAGRLDHKLLAYSEKRMIHDDDDDLVDEDESENMTGEAYACRLCAYSCDTEQRIKSHLMSAHISAEMYPFKCVSCKYEAPSVMRLAQHVLYKHQKLAPKNPPKLAKEMERDKDLWPKIMRDANKLERFQQELDCLFRNCVEKC